jgi:hypothetical protein
LKNEKAIDWVGDRYATGYEFKDQLSKCYFRFLEMNDGINKVIPRDLDEEWDSQKDIEFGIPESIAWDIKDLFETEDMLFPCFADEFKSKLIEFTDKIV